MSHDMQYGCGLALRAAAAAKLITLALLASGCAFLMPDRIHHVVDPSEQPLSRCTVEEGAESADRIFGVALSGGGSRAAVFGAAALEALSEHGALGDVSHISSVSGGSIASSYYLTYPHACDETASQACWNDYFSGYKEQMRANYWTPMLMRNLRPWRFSSNTRRAISLQEVLDKRFLHGKTFGELGSHPVLLINATNYDETRRFVFSNACLAAGPAEPPNGDDAEKRYRIMAATALEQRALQAFSFSRPQCVRPVPNDLPVSLAVVASAAFPPVTGPVSIQAPSSCDRGEPEWWHLGDGGVIENSGTDSLDEVLLRRLTDGGPRLKKVFILSMDAGNHPDPEKLKQRKNFKMYSSPARSGLVVDSPRVRGQAYHNVFWDELLEELDNEDIGYEKITLRHSEAKLNDLPSSCDGKLSDGETIRDLLQKIPTDLKINDCNADLLEMAAHQLVHATFDDEAVRRLTNEGFSIHTGRDCAMVH